MTKVLAGHQAPTFALNGTNGQPFSLADALRKGPVVTAFFKISCPVCQFTLPFLERLYETYGDDRVSFVGISQDDKRDTKEFCAEYDLSFPTVLDSDGYPVSNQYGLTNVPTVFSRSALEKPMLLTDTFPLGSIRKTVGTFVSPYWLETG